MASSIAALTAGGGGVATTADSSGNLDLKSGTTTVLALTATGIAVTGTLSASGVTTNAAGSAALPSITTTGDTDTGVWFPAANTLAASTAGAERMRIDSTGNVLVTNVAGLGYGTGSGGTVTQATSKSTAVTLNKPTGQITMNNAALASNTTVQFTLNNTICAATDIVVLSPVTTAIDMSFYSWGAAINGATAPIIYLRNISGGSRSEAVVFNFAIIKGATS